LIKKINSQIQLAVICNPTNNTQNTRGSELATGIAVRYDKSAERCWILALGGGVPRLYTMSTPKTQKSWNQGERVHSTKVREKLRERDRGPVPPLHESVPISR
jgi:hypothetical protein